MKNDAQYIYSIMILFINDILSMSAYTNVAYKILTVPDDNYYSILHDGLSFSKVDANERNRIHLVST